MDQYRSAPDDELAQSFVGNNWNILWNQDQVFSAWL